MRLNRIINKRADAHPDRSLWMLRAKHRKAPLQVDRTRDGITTRVKRCDRSAGRGDARAGQILISGSVHALADGHARTAASSLGEAVLKGFDQPVPIYELGYAQGV